MWKRYGIGVERRAVFPDGARERIRVLPGGDLEGHAFTLHPFQALCAIILGEKKSNGARLQRDRDQPPLPLMTPVDVEAEYGGVPANALLETSDRQ